MADTDCGGGATALLPHLDDGVVSEILYRLPTRDAWRVAAVFPRWRAVLSQPTFLCRHLSPRPLRLLDDRPYALQPRGKVRFTHLTLVATDPADRVPVDLPVRRKYVDPQSWPPRPPPPGLLETATDKSVFRLLYSTGSADATDDDDVPEDPEEDGAPDPDPAPSPPLEVEDYVVFFERTVPTLDISFVASHGRLLLGRSRSRYYVCDPAANRWIALPPPTTAPVRDTNSGLHYDVLDASTRWIAFTVVLLVRLKRLLVLVETFSSATGMWDARVLPAHGAARCLGAVSPGIHVGTSFYWLSRHLGCILRYDAARGRASVLREPPEAEQSKGRVARSLGSVGGRLRLCAFDIRDEHSGPMLPHDDLEGVHGVWVMDDGPAATGPWRRGHEAVVEDISTWFRLYNHEKPVDFAGACGEFIVVEKKQRLLRYDLESGSKVGLASLYRNSSRLGALYCRYHAFAFFRGERNELVRRTRSA